MGKQPKHVEDYNACPVCEEDAVLVSHGLLADRKCRNGHEWHRCLVHKVTVNGESDYGKSIYACQCANYGGG